MSSHVKLNFLPIMKPMSLYGSKQEAIKAIHKPTYSFCVISGCTHMNRLQCNSHHTYMHGNLCNKTYLNRSVLPKSYQYHGKGNFKPSLKVSNHLQKTFVNKNTVNTQVKNVLNFKNQLKKEKKKKKKQNQMTSQPLPSIYCRTAHPHNLISNILTF